MKNFGKIILGLCAIGLILAFTSCNFYSEKNARAAFELEKDMSEETGMDMAATFQCVFNKDGSCKLIYKVKILIFTVKTTAEGTWEAVNSSPDQSTACMKMNMEALKISIMGEEETISEAGTTYAYVYQDQLYLGGSESDYETTWADLSTLLAGKEYSLLRVFPN